MQIIKTILLTFSVLVVVGKLLDWVKKKDYGDEFGLIVITALIVFIICYWLFS